MSAPGGSRTGPPAPDHRDLHRSGVVARLRAPARVVAVVGGAGFGKSTAVAQAVAAEAGTGRGTVRYACQRADARPQHLVSGLVDAVGAAEPVDVPAALDLVLDRVARLGPDGGTLVLDDVHHLTGDGSGPLRHLVRDAPEPVRLVLVSRRPIPGLARLRAHGLVVDVTEEELRLTPEEQAELAEDHGVAADVVAPYGGWPALAVHACRTRDPGATAALARRALAPELRRSLAEVLAGGAVAPGSVEAAQSHLIPWRALVEAVPLTEVRSDGTCAFHPLWGTVLADELTPAEAQAARRRVARRHLAAGELERVVALTPSSDGEALAQAARKGCEAALERPSPTTPASWLALLPDDATSGPEASLLRGLAAVAEAPWSDGTVQLLDRARGAFHQRGDEEGEVMALAATIAPERGRGDAAALRGIGRRLGELAGVGGARTIALQGLARAAAAEAEGDVEAALAALDAVVGGTLSPGWRAERDLRRARALLLLGRGADAVPAPGQGPRPAAGGVGARAVRAAALWAACRPAEALEELPDLAALGGLAPGERVEAACWAATVLARAGRVEEAIAAVALAEGADTDGLGPRGREDLAGARAIVAVAARDERSAASTLAPLVGRDGSWLPGSRPHLAPVLVLVPEARSTVDQVVSGPDHHAALRAARALLVARAGDWSADEDLPSPGEVVGGLPLRWAVELASVVEGAGDRRARPLVAALARVHGARLLAALDDVADVDEEAVAGLRQATTPSSSDRAVVGVLGPTTLTVAGVPSETPAWRRRAVRALACLLVVRGTVSRDQAVGALWPDTDQARADGNLRAAVSQLASALEPDRRPGAPSSRLQADHRGLALVGSAAEGHDVQVFDRLVGEGDRARVAGVASEALAHYEAALVLWRGTPYSDLDDPAAVLERARLTARFVSASRRAAEVLLAAGQEERAIERLEAAVAVEPWSEGAHRDLATAHLAAGDHEAARGAIDTGVALLDEHGVEPSAATLRVRARIEAAARS
ncbi:BTAD domain-containing putative transcriptional regulator [Iamia majanohamensis]|uniref:BTAD domain-containing putative transcriptional regulator n=1 Tax=Iamia majanohamensis TaxID=467976 RepID=A0AAF0BTC8_9ACTN|nr:BTAD domain-containing putative transcriptional regulator [Iamia majanohamensis]WCO66607.1 BTAD domain-containing putative transcriptional regulator [Iamia majanohamensis]